jgi:hypothetical protein
MGSGYEFSGDMRKTSLDLIVPPPVISMYNQPSLSSAHHYAPSAPVWHSSGEGVAASASRDLSEPVTGGMSVVLHHPSSQRVVLWDHASQRTTVRRTMPPNACSLRTCPFCQRPLPTQQAQEDMSHGQQNPFVSPHYFALLSLQQQGYGVDSQESVDFEHYEQQHQDLSLPALPPSVPSAENIGPNSLRTQAVGCAAHNYFLLTDGQPPTTPARSQGQKAQTPPKKPYISPEVERIYLEAPDEVAEAAKCTGRELPKETMSDGYYHRYFEQVRRIGTGAFGSVYECRHVMDNVYLGTYAVKIAPVGDNRLWLRKVLTEVNHLQSLAHRNVVSASVSPSLCAYKYACMIFLECDQCGFWRVWMCRR